MDFIQGKADHFFWGKIRQHNNRDDGGVACLLRHRIDTNAVIPQNAGNFGQNTGLIEAIKRK